MISVQELALQYDCVSSIKIGAHPLAILARRSHHDRPARVTLQFRTWEHTEEAFVEARFDPSTQTLQPVLAYVCFQGSAAVCVLLGLRQYLVFHEQAEQPTARIALYRQETDDRGFYHDLAVAQPFGAVLIYEGGLMALSFTGRALWHRDKCWDDTFLGQVEGDIILLRESGERELINALTGESHVSVN